MKNEIMYQKRFVFVLITVLLFALGGCAPKSDVSAGDGLDSLPSMASTAGDFEDIELPADMKFSYKKSMSIRTDSFRGGIMYYTGRIDMYSLKEFIIASMKQHRWKLAGEVAGGSVLLAFTKPSKTCMMSIESYGSMSDTTLTMYITIDETAAKDLNAFGEPVR